MEYVWTEKNDFRKRENAIRMKYPENKLRQTIDLTFPHKRDKPGLEN